MKQARVQGSNTVAAFCLFRGESVKQLPAPGTYLSVQELAAQSHRLQQQHILCLVLHQSWAPV